MDDEVGKARRVPGAGGCSDVSREARPTFRAFSKKPFLIFLDPSARRLYDKEAIENPAFRLRSVFGSPYRPFDDPSCVPATIVRRDRMLPAASPGFLPPRKFDPPELDDR